MGALDARSRRERTVAVHDTLETGLAFKGIDVLVGRRGGSACYTTKNAALGFGKGSALHRRRYLCVVTQQLVLVFEQLDEVVRGRRVEAFLGEEVLEK